MNRTWKVTFEITCFGVTFLFLTSCRKASDDNEPSIPPKAVANQVESPAPPSMSATVSFPSELQVDDSAVNGFVQVTLAKCITGQYEALRSVWTARESPISREEFEKGWHAAKEIRVRALEKVKIAVDETKADSAEPPQKAYALVVDLSLDPEQQIGQRKPERQVVLLLTRESENWRLARAPKNMREWVKKKLDAEDSKSPLHPTSSDAQKGP